MNVNLLREVVRKQQRSVQEQALIEQAYAYAAKAHAGQKRKSGDPYIVHPLATATRLAQMRLDTQTVCAALLHDVCEDTAVTIRELAKEFGDEVAFIVEGVTKLDHIRYRGLERSAESLRKMFLAIGQDVRIVLLKLVDRLHNMETLSFISPEEKQKRIARETLEIYAPLAYRLGMKELSGTLEDLAFPYLYPQEHDWLMQIAKPIYENSEHYIQSVKAMLAQHLAKERVNVLDIHARAKHRYSLYKKLLRNDLDIRKVTDVVALRIIVATIEDCYATLGFVHTLWRPFPGKIKDYIALPKPNGYSSLHTTVFGPDEKPVEIQMRTPQMHEEAEYGIAAHWAYAESKRRRTDSRERLHAQQTLLQHPKFAWIKQLTEWQKDFEKPEEFLEALKIDFFKNRIFVFTPKGDIVDLPEGATPVDFGFQVHTSIGAAAVGAKVNERMVALDYQLKNGDVVQILTQKNRKPSAHWLEFVKSPHARKKIGGLLRKGERIKLFETKRGEQMELRVTARDRIGLLRDISNAFARQKVSIRSAVTGPKGQKEASFAIQASFRNHGDLEKVTARLKTVKNVREVSYKLLP